MSYYELWTILGRWRREFSSDDFARAFPSPDPRKVLSDMSAKGFLKRLERGKYSVVDSDTFVRSRTNVDEGYDLLERSKLPYALTGVDGVFVWTNGGYNANRFFGSYPIYINVPESRIDEWKAFIKENGKKFVVRGTRPEETLYGTYFALVPVARLEFRRVSGLNVEPLEKTVEFCRRESYTFEPALEMLDKEYKLGLNKKYAR